MRYMLSLLAMVVLTVSFMVACGDEKTNDPTDKYINGAATDESACKDACSKLASCMGEDATGKETFKDDCQQKCGQSGFFAYEVIVCIQKAECSQVFSCGAPITK